ncbi:hypothetical protein [Nonomuraea sp. GTA35]|uniref:hypothetical protein n=1 Tax=Nonomuraea sp. GTA35 TaxID=1676746 RepID=UPI0035C260A3
MTFVDAMLIDDRADNCAAFQQQMGTNDITEVVDSLNQWLEASADHRHPPQ